MSRKCINSPDRFCYICGGVVFHNQKRNFTLLVKQCYLEYFGFPVRNQDKTFTPHVCCITCVRLLTGWRNGLRHMPFAIPMIWREPKDHLSDCYFCLTNITGISSKSKHTVKYPDLPSATRPIPHSDDLPVPVPRDVIDDPNQAPSPAYEKPDDDPSFCVSPALGSSPHLLTQEALNDLVRDLDLPKQKAELLASRLKESNLLAPGTKVTYFRDRDSDLKSYFSQEDNLVFCIDVRSLMTALDLEYRSVEWRLFIDSSKASLKAVLLHNGNQFSSVSLAHAAGMKESYDNMKLLLNRIQYDAYKWKICGDLKVIAILLGLQLGYTKYCCFLCEWDSRDKENHYAKNSGHHEQRWFRGRKMLLILLW